jgi:hypothetical protein
MDLLCILTECNFGYNVIEVIEKISKIFSNQSIYKGNYEVN